MSWALTLAAAAGGAVAGALAALALQAEAARRDREHAQRLGRLHLAVSARLHEAHKMLRIERRRSDELLARLARTQGNAEEIRQTALEVSMLARLDALWTDSTWRDSQPAGDEPGAGAGY